MRGYTYFVNWCIVSRDGINCYFMYLGHPGRGRGGSSAHQELDHKIIHLGQLKTWGQSRHLHWPALEIFKLLPLIHWLSYESSVDVFYLFIFPLDLGAVLESDEIFPLPAFFNLERWTQSAAVIGHWSPCSPPIGWESSLPALDPEKLHAQPGPARLLWFIERKSQWEPIPAAEVRRGPGLVSVWVHAHHGKTSPTSCLFV